MEDTFQPLEVTPEFIDFGVIAVNEFPSYRQVSLKNRDPNRKLRVYLKSTHLITVQRENENFSILQQSSSAFTRSYNALFNSVGVVSTLDINPGSSVDLIASFRADPSNFKHITVQEPPLKYPATLHLTSLLLEESGEECTESSTKLPLPCSATVFVSSIEVSNPLLQSTILPSKTQLLNFTVLNASTEVLSFVIRRVSLPKSGLTLGLYESHNFDNPKFNHRIRLDSKSSTSLCLLVQADSTLPPTHFQEILQCDNLRDTRNSLQISVSIHVGSELESGNIASSSNHTVDFGNIYRGASKTAQVEITNLDSREDITVRLLNDDQISLPNNKVHVNDGSVVLLKDGQKTEEIVISSHRKTVSVWIQYSPSPDGEAPEVKFPLSFVVTTPSNKSQRIPIFCQAKLFTSSILVSTTYINFGDCIVGQTKKNHTLYIENLSPLPGICRVELRSKIVSLERSQGGGEDGQKSHNIEELFTIPPNSKIPVPLIISPQRVNPTYRKEVTVFNTSNPNADRQIVNIEANNMAPSDTKAHNDLYKWECCLPDNGTTAVDHLCAVTGVPLIIPYLARSNVEFPIELQFQSSSQEITIFQLSDSNKVEQVESLASQLRSCCAYDESDEGSRVTKIQPESVQGVMDDLLHTVSKYGREKKSFKLDGFSSIYLFVRIQRSSHSNEEHPKEDGLSVVVEGFDIPSRFIRLSYRLCGTRFQVRGQLVKNFGEVNIGTKKSTKVSVVNQCQSVLYLRLVKSSTATAGHIRMLNSDKKELTLAIRPYATKEMEITFNPGIKGSFEEKISLFNVLCPQNCYSMTLKASVIRADTFEISPDSWSFEPFDVPLPPEPYRTSSRFIASNTSKSSRQILLRLLSTGDAPSSHGLVTSTGNGSATPQLTFQELNLKGVKVELQLSMECVGTHSGSSRRIEEEIEKLDQKIKIYQRKNKKEKLEAAIERRSLLRRQLTGEELDSTQLDDVEFNFSESEDEHVHQEPKGNMSSYTHVEALPLLLGEGVRIPILLAGESASIQIRFTCCRIPEEKVSDDVQKTFNFMFYEEFDKEACRIVPVTLTIRHGCLELDSPQDENESRSQNVHQVVSNGESLPLPTSSSFEITSSISSTLLYMNHPLIVLRNCVVNEVTEFKLFLTASDIATTYVVLESRPCRRSLGDLDAKISARPSSAALTVGIPMEVVVACVPRCAGPQKYAIPIMNAQQSTSSQDIKYVMVAMNPSPIGTPIVLEPSRIIFPPVITPCGNMQLHAQELSVTTVLPRSHFLRLRSNRPAQIQLYEDARCTIPLNRLLIRAFRKDVVRVYVVFTPSSPSISYFPRSFVGGIIVEALTLSETQQTLQVVSTAVAEVTCAAVGSGSLELYTKEIAFGPTRPSVTTLRSTVTLRNASPLFPIVLKWKSSSTALEMVGNPVFTALTPSKQVVCSTSLQHSLHTASPTLTNCSSISIPGGSTATTKKSLDRNSWSVPPMMDATWTIQLQLMHVGLFEEVMTVENCSCAQEPQAIRVSALLQDSSVLTPLLSASGLALPIAAVVHHEMEDTNTNTISTEDSLQLLHPVSTTLTVQHSGKVERTLVAEVDSASWLEFGEKTLISHFTASLPFDYSSVNGVARLPPHTTVHIPWTLVDLPPLTATQVKQLLRHELVTAHVTGRVHITAENSQTAGAGSSISRAASAFTEDDPGSSPTTLTQQRKKRGSTSVIPPPTPPAAPAALSTSWCIATVPLTISLAYSEGRAVPPVVDLGLITHKTTTHGHLRAPKVCFCLENLSPHLPLHLTPHGQPVVRLVKSSFQIPPGERVEVTAYLQCELIASEGSFSYPIFFVNTLNPGHDVVVTVCGTHFRKLFDLECGGGVPVGESLQLPSLHVDPTNATPAVLAEEKLSISTSDQNTELRVMVKPNDRLKGLVELQLVDYDDTSAVQMISFAASKAVAVTEPPHAPTNSSTVTSLIGDDSKSSPVASASEATAPPYQGGAAAGGGVGAAATSTTPPKVSRYRRLVRLRCVLLESRLDAVFLTFLRRRQEPEAFLQDWIREVSSSAANTTGATSGGNSNTNNSTSNSNLLSGAGGGSSGGGGNHSLARQRPPAVTTERLWLGSLVFQHALTDDIEVQVTGTLDPFTTFSLPSTLELLLPRISSSSMNTALHHHLGSGGGGAGSSLSTRRAAVGSRQLPSLVTSSNANRLLQPLPSEFAGGLAVTNVCVAYDASLRLLVGLREGFFVNPSLVPQVRVEVSVAGDLLGSLTLFQDTIGASPPSSPLAAGPSSPYLAANRSAAAAAAATCNGSSVTSPIIDFAASSPYLLGSVPPTPNPATSGSVDFTVPRASTVDLHIKLLPLDEGGQPGDAALLPAALTALIGRSLVLIVMDRGAACSASTCDVTLAAPAAGAVDHEDRALSISSAEEGVRAAGTLEQQQMKMDAAQDWGMRGGEDGMVTKLLPNGSFTSNASYEPNMSSQGEISPSGYLPTPNSAFAGAIAGSGTPGAPSNISPTLGAGFGLLDSGTGADKPLIVVRGCEAISGCTRGTAYRATYVFSLDEPPAAELRLVNTLRDRSLKFSVATVSQSPQPWLLFPTQEGTLQPSATKTLRLELSPPSVGTFTAYARISNSLRPTETVCLRIGAEVFEKTSGQQKRLLDVLGPDATSLLGWERSALSPHAPSSAQSTVRIGALFGVGACQSSVAVELVNKASVALEFPIVITPFHINVRARGREEEAYGEWCRTTAAATVSTSSTSHQSLSPAPCPGAAQVPPPAVMTAPPSLEQLQSHEKYGRQGRDPTGCGIAVAAAEDELRQSLGSLSPSSTSSLVSMDSAGGGGAGADDEAFRGSLIVCHLHAVQQDTRGQRYVVVDPHSRVKLAAVLSTEHLGLPSNDHYVEGTADIVVKCKQVKDLQASVKVSFTAAHESFHVVASRCCSLQSSTNTLRRSGENVDGSTPATATDDHHHHHRHSSHGMAIATVEVTNLRRTAERFIFHTQSPILHVQSTAGAWSWESPPPSTSVGGDTTPTTTQQQTGGASGNNAGSADDAAARLTRSCTIEVPGRSKGIFYVGMHLRRAASLLHCEVTELPALMETGFVRRVYNPAERVQVDLVWRYYYRENDEDNHEEGKENGGEGGGSGPRGGAAIDPPQAVRSLLSDECFMDFVMFFNSTLQQHHDALVAEFSRYMEGEEGRRHDSDDDELVMNPEPLNPQLVIEDGDSEVDWRGAGMLGTSSVSRRVSRLQPEAWEQLHQVLVDLTWVVDELVRFSILLRNSRHVLSYCIFIRATVCDHITMRYWRRHAAVLPSSWRFGLFQQFMDSLSALPCPSPQPLVDSKQKK